MIRLSDYAKEKALPLIFLKELGLYEKDSTLVIPYFNEHGKVFRERYGGGEDLIVKWLDNLEQGGGNHVG